LADAAKDQQMPGSAPGDPSPMECPIKLFRRITGCRSADMQSLPLSELPFQEPCGTRLSKSKSNEVKETPPKPSFQEGARSVCPDNGTRKTCPIAVPFGTLREEGGQRKHCET
jgi:hypothetical protein